MLDLLIPSQQNLEFGAAVQRAINEWQVECWCKPEPRLKASIVVGQDDPEAAVAEIERCAATGNYVQVNISPRANEPLGRRRYWPIYEAAQAAGLPLGIHVGGYGGHAPTGGGWPSYYNEEHHSNAHSVAAQLTSLVIEGVPERFPKLKFVFIEGGFGWVPAITWRMDKHWQRFRDEVPHVKRPPSEYVREHFWFTTQPIEEPDNARHLRAVIEWIGIDRLLFSSDYPHWDFDDSALRLQDAAHRRRACQDLQRQRARRLQARLSRWPATSSPGRPRSPPAATRSSPSAGREIVVFHVNGEFFALLNRCPHEGAPLAKAACVAHLQSDEPGEYKRSRVGELLRCAWHGWEFDMRTGQSYFDPQHTRVRAYPVAVEAGETLAKGPYVAETFPVTVEESYVLIEV